MRVNQFQPFIGSNEYDAIKDCFDENWITEGPKCKEFEGKLLELTGAKYGAFANNGTLSLYMALKALGVGEGDEVLVPNFTFIASMNAVIMAGARPVLVDINRHTLHLDISKCYSALSDKTKAIMPVHIYGTAMNMCDVMRFANDNNLKVIEDAAQAIGVYWKDKHCGTFGDCGCFSFFADKTITTGEGGFVCTNDEGVYKKLLTLRNQGRINRGSFVHPEVGFNFRITDIQAAIGIVQMSKLGLIIRKKRNILSIYERELRDLSYVSIVKPEVGSNHVPFRVALMFDECVDGLSKFLERNDIEVRSFFYPLHRQPCASSLNSSNRNFTESNYVFDRGLCMPSYPTLEESKIVYVCDKIKEFFNEQ